MKSNPIPLLLSYEISLDDNFDILSICNEEKIFQLIKNQNPNIEFLIKCENMKDTNYSNSSFYGQESFFDIFFKSKSFRELEKKLQEEKTKINYEVLISSISEFMEFLEKNFSKVQYILKGFSDSMKGLHRQSFLPKNYQEVRSTNLSTEDVAKAMSWLEDWASMSRKKIPKEVWPLLQELTVVPSMLPKYAYRGIFFDGAKIPDQEKFLKKWSKGMKPGVSQGKATSWSENRSTAATFMGAQDFVKDSKNGYFILLKTEVKPEYVIADLQNVPGDFKWWNQEELIMSPEDKYYEVDCIIPGNSKEDYNEFLKSLKGNQTAWGYSKKEMLANYIGGDIHDLNVNIRTDWKQTAYMTTSEVEKNTDIQTIGHQKLKIL